MSCFGKKLIEIIKKRHQSVPLFLQIFPCIFPHHSYLLCTYLYSSIHKSIFLLIASQVKLNFVVYYIVLYFLISSLYTLYFNVVISIPINFLKIGAESIIIFFLQMIKSQAQPVSNKYSSIISYI